jgi:hypothetical protein
MVAGSGSTTDLSVAGADKMTDDRGGDLRAVSQSPTRRKAARTKAGISHIEQLWRSID